MLGVLILCAFAMLFSMAAKRLSSTVVTPPMAFLALGVVLSEVGLFPAEGSEALLHVVAEVALVVLLFLDAAQVDPVALLRRHVWPVRMLLIGLPACVLLGTLSGLVFLPGWPLAAVALMAAILAPTDAALGQAVVSNEAVPVRPRRALTVESGLNDGLALPVILLLASLAVQGGERDETNWAAFAAMQLVLGPAVGVAVGGGGGLVLLRAKALDYTADTYEGVGALALAGTAYLGATLVGGNGFIAAFAAGLAFGAVVKGACAFVYEFAEGEGQLLTWGAFFLLGVALVPEAVRHLTLGGLGLILVSLLVVRPAAIWLSLLGTDASATTRLFFGWFGPRGLATALFALLVVSEIDHEVGEPILHLAVNAVWISALLHGVTAAPGARWYAARVARMGECAEMRAEEGGPGGG